jgi:outer membrane protein TolC
VAATEADAERSNSGNTRRRLIADLKTAYVEYQCLNRSLDVLQRNKERLEQFRQIAEARFSVESFPARSATERMAPGGVRSGSRRSTS